MRNAAEVDLGELDLERARRGPARRASRRRWPLVATTAVSLAAALVWSRDPASDPPHPSPTPPTDPAAGIVVFEGHRLDDVLLLGLPFGFDDRGLVARIVLATGRVTTETAVVTSEPLSARAPVSSPDGRHAASFTASARTRGSGVSVFPDGGPTREFHRLQSVVSPVGRGLAWSPASDVVYLLATDAEGGTADRVIAIPVGGSARTVVRIDSRGWQTLEVSARPGT